MIEFYMVCRLYIDTDIRDDTVFLKHKPIEYKCPHTFY